MGVVFQARQVRAEREVAIKMILGSNAVGSPEASRFRAETLAASRLQHPSIVAIFEVGDHEGLHFFSMEYCPGGSLASAIKGRQLPAQEAAELLLKIATGMAVAHAAGIVHRDLKPGNVLLSAEGEPKIADFGLAKLVGTPGEELTVTGAILGTPTYMAPEQVNSARRASPAADVYALGVMLYEFLLGHPPFRSSTATETLLLVLTEDPRPPRKVCPTVPMELEAICLRCLEKDPIRRYPTAKELADDLTRFLAGDPVSAAQSGAVRQLVGAISRVKLQSRFGDYGNQLLAMAPAMFLPELWVTAVTWNNWPGHLLALGQFGRLFTFLLILGYFRRWQYWPNGPAERQLWLVWGGYLACCFVFGFSSRIQSGFLDTRVELQFYQGLACLTGMAFFALASNFWGYCAVVGAGFLSLSFVMAIDLDWAPIEFGAAWATVLIIIGLRLRKLASAGSQLAEHGERIVPNT